jgi:hypothetical protein
MKIWYLIIISFFVYSCGGTDKYNNAPYRTAYSLENRSTYELKVTFELWPKNSHVAIDTKVIWLDPGEKNEFFGENYFHDEEPTQPNLLFKNMRSEAYKDGMLVAKMNNLPFIEYHYSTVVEEDRNPVTSYNRHDFVLSIQDADLIFE